MFWNFWTETWNIMTFKFYVSFFIFLILSGSVARKRLAMSWPTKMSWIKSFWTMTTLMTLRCRNPHSGSTPCRAMTLKPKLERNQIPASHKTSHKNILFPKNSAYQKFMLKDVYSPQSFEHLDCIVIMSRVTRLQIYNVISPVTYSHYGLEVQKDNSLSHQTQLD